MPLDLPPGFEIVDEPLPEGFEIVPPTPAEQARQREQAYYATQQAVQQGLIPDPRGPSSYAAARFAQGAASGANKLFAGGVAAGAEAINSLASLNAARNPADVRAHADMMRLQYEVAGKPLPKEAVRDPMGAAAASLRQDRRIFDTKKLIRDMDRAIDLAFPTDDSKASVAGQITGNIVGRIGSIVANPVLGIGVGGLGTGGEGVREAVETGQLGTGGSDANILASSLVDGVLTGIGISRGRQLVDERGGELIDRLVRFATKAKNSGNPQLAQKGEQVRQLLSQTGVAMGTGAAENVAGEVAINRIAQETIGSERGTFDGAGIAAGLGAAFPLAGGAGRYLAMGRRKPNAPPTLKSQQEARTAQVWDVDAEAAWFQQHALDTEAAEKAAKAGTPTPDEGTLQVETSRIDDVKPQQYEGTPPFLNEQPRQDQPNPSALPETVAAPQPAVDSPVPLKEMMRKEVARRVANAPPDAAASRSQAMSRAMEKLVNQFDNGNMSEDMLFRSMDTLIQRQREVQGQQTEGQDTARGADWLRQRILQAKRDGDVPPEGADLALWLLDRSPHLANDLGIRVRQPEQGEGMIRGMYSRIERMMTLFKGNISNYTAVHELLHHAERFMPLKVQDAIRREWLRRVLKLPNDQRDIILRANNGDADAKQALSLQVYNRMVPYELANPSELWAARATELLKRRFDVNGSAWKRAHQWLGDLTQKARGLLGLDSDAPMVKALDQLLKEMPEDAAGTLLSRSNQLRKDATPDKPLAPKPPPIDPNQGQLFQINIEPLLDQPGMKAAGSNIRMERPGILAKLRDVAMSIRNRNQQPGYRMTARDKVLKYVTNEKQALDAAVDYITNGVPVMDADNPVVLASLEAGTDSMTEVQLRFGLMDTRDPNGIKPMLDDQGNHLSISYLFPDAIRGDVKTMKKWLKATVEYGVAQRTIDLAKRFGRDDKLTGIGKATGEKDLVVAVRVLKEVSDNPQIKGVLDESLRRYRALADGMLVKLKDAGYIDQKRLDGYRKHEKFYIDLERVMDDVDGIKLLSRIEGSDRMIDNPYVSLISMLGRVEKAIARNDAKKALVDMALRFGKVGNRPDALIRAATKAGKDTIEVRRAGKVEHWTVPADIKEAFDGYMNDSTAIRVVGAVLGSLGRLKRELIAQSPKFISNNVIRDWIDRLIVTRAQPGILAGFKGTDKLLNPKAFSDTKMELLLSGGGNSTLLTNTAKVTYDRLWNRELQKISAEGSAGRTIVMLAKRLPFQWRKVSEGSEYINRVVEYASAKEYAKTTLGMNDRQARIYAADKARKILDFARMGKAVRAINTIIYQPFLNASIQGIARDMRLMRTKPGTITARYAMFILMPEIMVRSLSEAFASDETKERLKNMSDFRRFGAWNIGMGDWIVSIPKPFMWAAMTAPATAAMEAYWNDVAVNFRGVGQAFVRALVPPLGVDVVPGAMEIAANYNFFTGQNIVPPNQAGLDMSLRDTETASALGTGIANFIRGMGLDITNNLDPRYVDAYLQAQGGGTAQMAMALSDLLQGTKPDRTMRAVGSVTSFVTVPAAGSAPGIQRLNERATRIRDEGSKDVHAVRSLLRRASKAENLAERNKLLDAAYKAAERGNEFYDRHEANLLAYRQATQEINRIRTELSQLRPHEQAAYVAANRRALQASAQIAQLAQALGAARTARFEAAAAGRDTERLDAIIEQLLRRGIDIATAAQK